MLQLLRRWGNVTRIHICCCSVTYSQRSIYFYLVHIYISVYQSNVDVKGLYKYIYIYIYIFIHRQTVSLYHNSSVWLETEDAWSWDRNLPNVTLDLVSERSANVGFGNYKILGSNSSSSVHLYTFYTLLDTKVLNSFEELCIMRAAAENSFHQSAQPPWGNVYIVIHRQIRCMTTLQSG